MRSSPRSMAITQASDRASAEAAHSDPEREEAHATAAETDRRRRDAADLDHTTGQESRRALADTHEASAYD